MSIFEAPYVKVKFLSDTATLPEKGSPGAAGFAAGAQVGFGEFAGEGREALLGEHFIEHFEARLYLYSEAV